MTIREFTTNSTETTQTTKSIPKTEKIIEGLDNIKLEDYTDLIKQNIDYYFVPKKLAEAVQIAIWLGRPILITGEPGVGKSQFAYALAKHFEQAGIIEFHTKSTSTSKDLLYFYDAISHFQATEIYRGLSDTKMYSPKLEERMEAIETNFVSWQGLGEAILKGKELKKRQVVLIDEIDKAPKDFPNDLLNELDKMAFTVTESKRKHEGESMYRPIVIITSNSEKSLPDAFLRRCVYVNIEIPTEEELLTILSKKLSLPKDSDNELLIKHFMSIRDYGLSKKPATAELLSWVSILRKMDFKVDTLTTLKNNPEKIDPKMIEILKYSYSILAKTKNDIEKMYNALARI